MGGPVDGDGHCAKREKAKQVCECEVRAGFGVGMENMRVREREREVLPTRRQKVNGG